MKLRPSIKPHFLLAVLLCMVMQFVRAADSSYSLVVYTVDGVRTAYAFADRPIMTIEGITFHIRSDAMEAEYAATDIQRFTLEASDSPEPSDGYWLVVHTTSGQADGYAFADRPEVRISGQLFNVSAASRTVAYPAANIERFTIDDHYTAQGVATSMDAPRENIPVVDDSPRLHLTPGTVNLSGLRPGSIVRVSDVSGRLAITTTADADGSLSISTEPLRPGVYVVSTGKATFKILKK